MNFFSFVLASCGPRYFNRLHNSALIQLQYSRIRFLWTPFLHVSTSFVFLNLASLGINDLLKVSSGEEYSPGYLHVWFLVPEDLVQLRWTMIPWFCLKIRRKCDWTSSASSCALDLNFKVNLLIIKWLGFPSSSPAFVSDHLEEADTSINSFISIEFTRTMEHVANRINYPPGNLLIKIV